MLEFTGCRVNFFFLLYNFREMWFLFCRVIVSSVELALYVFVYDNFHLVTLPWDSPWTWYICLFGVDFFYYWFHRAAHGRFINILPKKQIIYYYSNLFFICHNHYNFLNFHWCINCFNYFSLITEFISITITRTTYPTKLVIFQSWRICKH